MEDNKILVILGPTSTGKTDLGIKLAKKFNGELVSCDSRQVYKRLDIGTGKMPGEKVTITKEEGLWEMDGIKVWMYDVADPNRQYTVYDYVKDANRIIDEILERGKLPIIVGGTGLYFKALLDGLPNLAIPVDLKLRRKLYKLSLEDLQKKLQGISLQKWEKMNNSDRQNPRRLVRAIELVTLSLREVKRRSNLPRIGRIATLIARDDNVLKIGLTASREVLFKKINDKVLEWVENGIVNEVSNLMEKGVDRKRFMDLGLEYAVAMEYLEKKISLDQMIEKMQCKVRQYAKRQITWFKKERNVCWFDISHKNYADKVENLVAKWYDTSTTYAAKD